VELESLRHFVSSSPKILGRYSPKLSQGLWLVIFSAKPVNEKLPTQSSSSERRAELLKTVGVGVLVLGLVAASVIYWSGEKRSAIGVQSRQSSDLQGSWKDDTLLPEDLKGSSRTIEMNYGKVFVLVVNFVHRWQALKPHQFFAALVAMIAALIAMSCFLVAHHLLRKRI
jgi:hypothetical protein